MIIYAHPATKNFFLQKLGDDKHTHTHLQHTTLYTYMYAYNIIHSYQWRLCETVCHRLEVPHAHHDLWELGPLEHDHILCKECTYVIVDLNTVCWLRLSNKMVTSTVYY